MSITITGQWRWRDYELSMKEFNKLSKTEKNEYFILLKGLSIPDRGTTDQYIITLYNLDNKNTKDFFSMSDDLE